MVSVKVCWYVCLDVFGWVVVDGWLLLVEVLCVGVVVVRLGSVGLCRLLVMVCWVRWCVLLGWLSFCVV